MGEGHRVHEGRRCRRLVKDDNGKVKEHKLGKRAGKKGMGIGVALGVVAAIPTGGLSLLGSAAGGVVGGGVIGDFFHKGLKMSDEDATRIASELDAGRAAVGVLAWDFESDAVADKLKEAGGTPQVHEVAKLGTAAQPWPTRWVTFPQAHRSARMTLALAGV